MKRIFALFLLSSLLLLLSSDSIAQCGGTERWTIKVLADKASNKINIAPDKKSVAELISLATTPSGRNTPRQQIELKTFQVDCNIKGYFTEGDSDVHVILADLNDPSKTMIGEIPNPDCKSVDKSGRKTMYQSARDAFGSFCVDGSIIRSNKVHMVKPGKYRIVGVGFVDFAHGQRGKAPNNLEIHPILKIEKL